MSYNVWRKGREGEPLNEIRLANLTMARHSWSLESHMQGNIHDGQEGEEVVSYIITGEKMIAKNPKEDGNYIGWWSPESASRFDSKRWQVTYEHKLHQRSVSENDLPADSRNEIQDDISSEEDDGHSSEEELLTLAKPGVRNQAIDADVILSYPFGDGQENLTFKGTFQWNGRISPAYRTFVETFTLGSTLHSLQVDSHSLWTKAGNEKVILSHHSTLVDTKTKRNHGTYDLKFRKQLENSCMNVHLNHSLTAHWVNFASHVIGTCKNGKPKARLYDIRIHTDLPYWSELNFDLNQKFDLDMPGGENMNLTSPTMDIGVTGKWTPKLYHKKAVFKSKSHLIPSTSWELTSNKEEGTLDLSIDAPNELLESVKLYRKLYKTKDKIEYLIKHKEKHVEGFHQDAHFSAKVINSNSLLLNGTANPKLGLYLFRWLSHFIAHNFMNIAQKLANPNHELNQSLKTHLQGQTIVQYLNNLQMRFCQQAGIVVKDIAEIIRTFESFYGPSFKIVSNTAREITILLHNTFQSLASSHLGRAWIHFDVVRYIEANFMEEDSVWRMVDYMKDHHFKTVYHHDMNWNKFNEWPKMLDKDEIHEFFQWFYGKESSLTLPTRSEGQRVAMVFGPSHILTFDGRHYTFPDYPSDSCTMLLAQDIRGKTFSALINKESLFLIFPEMALTIHGSGRLYVNSSTTESATPIFSTNRNVQVNRFGDIIRVESRYLRVDCDTNNEFCIFVLDPVLSGGIVGLLGNADGEKHNEFASPESRLISSAAELGIVYELSNEPSCNSFTDRPPLPVEDAQAARRCNRLLKQAPVVHCLAAAGLKEEDIRPACVSDFYREGCPCATSKALTALCAYEGFSLDRCQFQRRPEGSLPVPNHHESWIIKGTRQLQLVIIVETHKSVLSGKSNQALKGMETLLENIEETFTSEGGYLSPMYALVAYGSEEEEKPHMYTQHRSAWMSQNDLMKSLRSVPFLDSERGDPITAIKFATSMIGFEPSATKIVLLITLDDTVQASDSDHIYDVQQHLEINGAPLYVLASYPGLERGKKIFGLRADGLIFPNHDGNAYGDFPRSPCAKLVAGTRGSIFGRNHLEENKNPFFFESLSGEMLARVQKEAGKCRQCTCVMSPWWQAHTHCKPAPNHLQKC